MKNKNMKALWGLSCILIVMLFSLIFISFYNTGVMKIGIFYGSNWEVPGTIHYEIIDRAIEIFHETYPQIEVEYEEGILYEDYSEWLASSLITGEAPDVYLVLSDDFECLVTSRSLVNLEGFLSADPAFDPDVFYKNAYDAGKYKGKQYALPFECNPTLMFANETLLENMKIDLPDNDWTWNDLDWICRAIQRDQVVNRNDFYYGIYDYNWQNALAANGITLFDPEGSQIYVTEESFQDALHFMKTLNSDNGNQIVTARDFDLGHVAFRPMTFSEYRTYMPYPWRIKKYSNFDWNCIAMPKGPNGINTANMDVLTAGISSKSMHRKEAWDFLKILTSNEEIQTMVYAKTSGASPVCAVTNSEKVQDILNRDTPGEKEIDLSLLDQAISDGVVLQKFSGYDEAEAFASKMIDEYLSSDYENTMELFRIENDVETFLKDKHTLDIIKGRPD